jgi:formate dehydrogenase subunit delta
MEIETLVHMANRIGQFFDAMPDRSEALDGVATHLRNYWDPRMRRQLFTHVDEHAGEGLSDFVLESLKGHRTTLFPAAQMPPGEA